VIHHDASESATLLVVSHSDTLDIRGIEHLTAIPQTPCDHSGMSQHRITFGKQYVNAVYGMQPVVCAEGRPERGSNQGFGGLQVGNAEFFSFDGRYSSTDR
jgi:hypothetical protein